MWAIRILSGPQAGQIFNLKEGRNKIGRALTCDFQLNSPGVSKEHVELTALSDKVLITDLQSSNGTFLNGVRIKGGTLKLGDKVSIHNILFDLIAATEKLNALVASRTLARPSSVPAQPPPRFAMPPAPMMTAPSPLPPSAPPQSPQTPPVDVGGLWQKIQTYMDRVVLPSLYQITENFEFRFVLMGSVGLYVLLVTLLSVIPMKQITSETISVESRRRALTVARTLAHANERVLRSGDIANFSTDLVLREEGVSDVYIVSKEGTIVAPPERVGNAPREAGFIQKIRGTTRESTGEFAGKIGAAVPILGYDAEIQQNVARAYAVIIYNPGSLAFDDGRAFSLFIQMFAIALIIGAILFFFLYKLVEYPFLQLNDSLDSALRDGRDHAEIRVQLPVLQNLLTNVNSLLTRAASARDQNAAPAATRGSKNVEYFNVVQMIGFPALLVSREGLILKMNHAFEGLTNLNPGQVENHRVESLPDQAMQKNILELMNISASHPIAVASDSLEFSGHLFQLKCQALTTATGDVENFLLTISPMEGAEGNAA